MAQELTVAEQRERSHRDERRRQPRELRFAPAGPEEYVGEDPRCDQQFENAEAERRREIWEAEAVQRDRARQAGRQHLTLGQRLDRALGALTAMSTAPARRIERGRGGESEHVGPPPAPEIDGLERELRVARYAIEQIEAILDSERGAHRMPAARMIGAEKDRIIWDNFQGVRSAEVARVAPYLGGSARTIERARAREAEERGLRCKLTTGEVLGPVLRTAA
jgi:hypothetical protein